MKPWLALTLLMAFAGPAFGQGDITATKQDWRGFIESGAIPVMGGGTSCGEVDEIHDDEWIVRGRASMAAGLIEGMAAANNGMKTFMSERGIRVGDLVWRIESYCSGNPDHTEGLALWRAWLDWAGVVPLEEKIEPSGNHP